MRKPIVWSFGGGVQSTAIAVLIAKGVLPKPDLVVMADTSRESARTWHYMDQHVKPLLKSIGLEINIAPHSLASADIWNSEGAMLMPAYTETGKMTNFCSGYWKRDVCERFVASKGVKAHTLWLGMSFDEQSRMSKGHRPNITNDFPLYHLVMRRPGCEQTIEEFGLPPAPKSSCFQCPHRRNPQWRDLRDNLPEEFEAACKIDTDIREVDLAEGKSGLWLHESRIPLRMAPIDKDDEPGLFNELPCNSGFCFV